MFQEINNSRWETIEPLFSRPTHRGRPPASARQTLNGILWVLLTGNPWHAIPMQYSSPSTCWRRFRQWSADGTWEKIWEILVQQLEPAEQQDWSEALFRGYFIPTKSVRSRTSPLKTQEIKRS